MTMQRLKPLLAARIDWETRAQSALCALLDCGNGDAQGIIEAQGDLIDRCWLQHMTPEQAAAAIDKASEPADPGRQPDVRVEDRVATVATVNLDDLRRLREEAMAAGAGSGKWIKAAQALMDAFPAYYATALSMNARAAAQRYALRSMWTVAGDMVEAFGMDGSDTMTDQMHADWQAAGAAANAALSS